MRSLALAACLISCLAGVLEADDRNRAAEALEAMQAGRYEKAKELLEEHLEAYPGDARASYNLACSYSRLGDQEEAARALEVAWKAGLRDIDLIQSDVDLEGLRGSKRGQKLIRRLAEEEAERQRRRGRPLLFDATVMGAGRVVLPDHLEEGSRVPLVVALHGNGGTPEPMAGMFFAAGLSPDLAVLAPYGPYTVRHAQGVGHSWYPPLWLFNEELARRRRAGEEDRAGLERHEQDVSETFVLASIEAACRDYAEMVDCGHVFVLGFSQGGALAYGLALSHPGRFAGLVAVGAAMPAVSIDEERLAAAAGRIEALVCHSPDDEAIAFDRGKAAHERLTRAGIESRFVRYDGGHALTAALLRRIARWIDETAGD
jgi:phospholipase/carboxylesterase